MGTSKTTTEPTTFLRITAETLTAAHSLCSAEFTWPSCVAARRPAIFILILERRGRNRIHHNHRVHRKTARVMGTPKTTTEPTTFLRVTRKTLTAAHSLCSAEFTWPSCVAARSPAVLILILERWRSGVIAKALTPRPI